MAQLSTNGDYPALVKQAMQGYKSAAVANALDPLPYELALVFDDEHQQYILRSVGWQKNRRVLTTILHVAIRDGKLWIEEDWTEDGIATYFLEHDVPNDQNVLGFQAPTMRPYTEFAVA